MSAPDYTRKLSRKITLKDGRELATLLDAANLLLGFQTKKDDARDHAGRLLIAAAESGKRKDIRAATDQVERVLVMRLMIDL